MEDEYGAVVEWWIARGKLKNLEEPAAVPLCPPQISLEVVWVAEVKSQCPSALFKACSHL
jgi:hypothetical protein